MPSVVLRVFLAAATAALATAAFSEVLLGLPAIVPLKDQAPELGLVLAPTAASLACLAVFATARRVPFGGYAFVAAAGFGGVWVTMALTDRVSGPDVTGFWFVSLAACGGLALGGLLWVGATTAGAGEPPAIAAGIGAGLGIGSGVGSALVQGGWPRYLLALLACVAALLAMLLLHDDAAPHRDAAPHTDAAPPAGPGGPGGAVGAMLRAVLLAGVVVVAGRVGHSVLTGQFSYFSGVPTVSDRQATLAILAVAAGAALILTVCAYRVGGAALARWPVLGFAVAPAAILFGGGLFPLRRDVPGMVVALVLFGLSLAAGAIAARVSVLAWEAVGVVAVACGFYLVYGGNGDSTVVYLLVLCGTGFAVAAGVSHATALPHGAPLGLASLVLSAQAFGPVVLGEVFRLADRETYLAPIVVAVGAAALFVLQRVARTGYLGAGERR